MTCCISPNGSVYPCAFLQEPEFLVGNIHYHDFQDMWDQSPIFNHLRNLRVDTCQSCARFEQCRGGCPAMAFHTYHDLNMPDPECIAAIRLEQAC
jgi:radical SAM protein with 4Fe4S-binding SPASM domain